MPPIVSGITPSAAVTDPLTKRIAHYRRVFTRGRGRKTTGLQSDVVMHAAVLTARAEQAALDPCISANDLVRLSNEARRARADMEVALTKRDEPEAATEAMLGRYLEATA
jgi:hypothetical protein